MCMVASSAAPYAARRWINIRGELSRAARRERRSPHRAEPQAIGYPRGASVELGTRVATLETLSEAFIALFSRQRLQAGRIHVIKAHVQPGLIVEDARFSHNVGRRGGEWRALIIVEALQQGVSCSIGEARLDDEWTQRVAIFGSVGEGLLEA